MANNTSEIGAEDGSAEPLQQGDLPELTNEQKRMAMGAMSKLISASIGDMVVLMSRAPSHKHYSLADIEWMVLPPVLSNQFYISEAAHQELGTRAPLAFVTWARVSDEVDARLSDPERHGSMRLRPEEWSSGDHFWLIDLVGDPRGLSNGLHGLMDGPFKDKTVKVVTRDASGSGAVETLEGLLARAQEISAKAQAGSDASSDNMNVGEE